MSHQSEKMGGEIMKEQKESKKKQEWEKPKITEIEIKRSDGGADGGPDRGKLS